MYGTIPRHLVVLDVLRLRDQSGIEHVLLGVFLDHLVRFLDQAFHADPLLPARTRLERLEDLLEALDVSFGLREVVENAFFKSGFVAFFTIFGNALTSCFRRCRDPSARRYRVLVGFRHRVRVPEIPMYLDALLADQPLTGGLEPMLGAAHLRVLTVVGFPTATVPEFWTT